MVERRFGDAVRQEDIDLPPEEISPAPCSESQQPGPASNLHAVAGSPQEPILQAAPRDLSTITPRVVAHNASYEARLAAFEEAAATAAASQRAERPLLLTTLNPTGRNFVAENKANAVSLRSGAASLQAEEAQTGELLRVFDPSLAKTSPRALRERLCDVVKQDPHHHWTYSEEFLSLSVPRGDPEQLRREEEKCSKEQWLTKEGFRNFLGRTAAESRRPVNAPSEARLQELREPFVKPAEHHSGSTVQDPQASMQKKQVLPLAADLPKATPRAEEADNKARREREHEEWRKKLVVDDPVFQVGRCFGVHPLDVVGRTLLHEPPKKAALASRPLEGTPVSILTSEKFEPVKAAPGLAENSFWKYPLNPAATRTRSPHRAIAPLTEADREAKPLLFHSVQHDLRRAMACEITAVNDDLDDATIAFIEKHASILDEEDPFLCFIDELDDHRAIFRSMDQLSRLSFTSTMIPEFGKLFGYLVASEKRIPSTKLLQRISLSILRLPASPLLYREYRWRPRSRPTCGFGEPVHCFAAIRPVSKVTEHCQTASRKSDRTLHRPLSCPASAWRWYESATTRWYMGTRMPNAQEVPM
ncbi:hypothetical protein PAPYR_6770 [Paratrimastix pyriformis]|uniref:Uncharacterized protein n=2 Tax=Paratrimastix pyriformis TaxID=342808 RepID=A0ABQ8UKB2_9EUKA|nr:hypothetical protein PAPYR_6770 [Paratrimastix pyriformis]